MQLEPKRRKLIINILTVAVPILSAVAIYFGLQIALATNTPFVAVVSGSMSPALEMGDLLIIQGVTPENIREGDIIMFTPPAEYGNASNIHRVTRIQKDNGTLLFKTKGDANDSEDPYWIPDSRVHGLPIYRIPYMGYLILYPTIPIMITMAVIIIILAWPEKSKRRLRRRRRKISYSWLK